MNFKEAAKSGKEFKRLGTDTWCRYDDGRLIECDRSFGIIAKISILGALADDWIVKEDEDLKNWLDHYNRGYMDGKKFAFQEIREVLEYKDEELCSSKN